jgi:hypothetical protein
VVKAWATMQELLRNAELKPAGHFAERLRFTIWPMVPISAPMLRCHAIRAGAEQPLVAKLFTVTERSRRWKCDILRQGSSLRPARSYVPGKSLVDRWTQMTAMGQNAKNSE